MKYKSFVLSWMTFCCLGAEAQQLGIATIPSESLKTAILIERRRFVTNETFIPVPGATAIVRQEGTTNYIIPATNIFIKIPVGETIYDPLGSGCLLSYSNMILIVTAGHVIPPDEDVYFRIIRTNKEVIHYSHREDKKNTQLGWIRATNCDLAITTVSLTPFIDDVWVTDILSLSATYDQVKIGDEVFVVGYPASITDVRSAETHVIRNGIISSKQGDAILLVDSFVFPGNSGGPVFWKPSQGLDYGPGISGPKFEGRGPALVGIVLSYLSYREEAISPKTSRTRVVFEENSGLAQVISATRVLELIKSPPMLDYLEKWLGLKKQ